MSKAFTGNTDPTAPHGVDVGDHQGERGGGEEQTRADLNF